MTEQRDSELNKLTAEVLVLAGYKQEIKLARTSAKRRYFSKKYKKQLDYLTRTIKANKLQHLLTDSVPQHETA